LRIDKSRLTHVRDSVQQEYNQLWSDKRALEESSQRTIRELEATIRSLKSSSNSRQGQRYEVYGKSKYYAKTYYKHPNGYMYETGVQFDDHTIVYLYYTSNGYGLTDKGYFKLEDIRSK
jgi:hypothetical protein